MPHQASHQGQNKQMSKAVKKKLKALDKKDLKEATGMGAVKGGMMGSAYGLPGVVVGGITGGALARAKEKKRQRVSQLISDNVFQGEGSLTKAEYDKRMTAYELKKGKMKKRKKKGMHRMPDGSLMKGTTHPTGNKSKGRIKKAKKRKQSEY